MRKIVISIRSSSKRTEKFKEIQQDLISREELDIREPLKLISDVETRWNSSYLMLTRALKLRVAIDKANRSMRELPESDTINWDQLESIIKLLQPFHEVTERFCGEKYTTISIITAVWPKLMQHCEDECLGFDMDRNLTKQWNQMKGYKT